MKEIDEEKDCCCECEHEHHEHDHHGHEHEHSCACGCEHCERAGELNIGEEEEEEGSKAFIIIKIAISAILMILGLLPLFDGNIKLIFFIASAIVSGYELIPEAFEELKDKKLGENLLMLIAITAAFAIGEGFEAAAVSLFFRVGESIEDYSVEKSKKAIKKLYEISNDTATVVDADGKTKKLDSCDIKVGDIILVSPFEKVPVDCVAFEDGGSVDTSAVTGEAIPVEITEGTKILSGSINGPSAIRLKATAAYEDSAAARIIKTVEQSAKNKSSTDKFITKFASVYTPIVVSLAVLLAVIPSLVTGNWTVYIHRALIFLVASCPCALVLSVPLGFFAAIGAQSKKGIVVKGGKFIEALSKTDAVLFDKTGTLTDDNFEITDITVFDGYTKEDLLKYAGYAEKYSTHPLSEAVKRAYPDVDESKISNFSEIKGSGTRLIVDGKNVICGSEKLLRENNIEFDTVSGAQIYVALDGKAIGALTLAGKLREQSKAAVEGLRALGIKRIVMLTGDNEAAAKAVAEKCSVTEVKAQLLPEDKTEFLKQLQSEGNSVAFVGDGINDTPTLSEADVGIAMGSGTAAAIETGDVVLMNSNPANIVSAVRMSRHAMRVIKGNVAFAIAVKIAVLILGALGLAPMWAAVFADVGVCIICVLNSTRLLLDGKKYGSS